METLNLVLQGVEVMHTETCTIESKFKMTSYLKGIRYLAKNQPHLKELVSAAIKPTKALLNNVFQRLHLITVGNYPSVLGKLSIFRARPETESVTT